VGTHLSTKNSLTRQTPNTLVQNKKKNLKKKR